MEYVFGIDVGGTTVKIGLFTTDGTLVDKWEIPTNTSNGGKAILPDVAASLEEKMKERGIDKASVKGAGIGVPGPVTDDGVVNHCVNLGWGIMHVTEELKALTGFEVKAGNDANVAALGEVWKGGGRGYDNVYHWHGYWRRPDSQWKDSWRCHRQCGRSGTYLRQSAGNRTLQLRKLRLSGTVYFRNRHSAHGTEKTGGNRCTFHSARQS